MAKILVLDLERIGNIVQVFDELGIELLEDHKIERPLWSLANIEAYSFRRPAGRVFDFEKIIEIRKQMLGEKHFPSRPVPTK